MEALLVDKLDGVEIGRIFATLHYEYDMESGLEHLDFMCGKNGNSVDYMLGQDVPYRTWWYNYGKDFLIIKPSPSAKFGEKNYVFEISDGKLVGKLVYDIEHPEWYVGYFDFDKYHNVFTDQGVPMKISSDEDLYYYFFNNEDCNKRIEEVRHRFDTISKPLYNFVIIMNDDRISLGGKLLQDTLSALSEVDDWFVTEMDKCFALVEPYFDRERQKVHDKYGMLGVYLYTLHEMAITPEPTYENPLFNVIIAKIKEYVEDKGIYILSDYNMWNGEPFDDFDKIIRYVMSAGLTSL